MTYNPPAGLLGHGVAALLGADPKRALDDDLLRFKSLLEHGRTTTDGGRTYLGDVLPVDSLPEPTPAASRSIASGTA
jgi:hypothetical protein